MSRLSHNFLGAFVSFAEASEDPMLKTGRKPVDGALILKFVKPLVVFWLRFVVVTADDSDDVVVLFGSVV